MAHEGMEAAQASRGEPPLGTQLGRYRLDAIVGRGGMGTVYRAYDAETQREVAVKLLLPDLAPSLRERFLAESEAEAKIRHPHVMPVYDRGVFDGDRLYFVMELLYEPITLSDLVETREKGVLGSTWPRLRHWGSHTRLVQDVLVPICEGVDTANGEYGILHRDLKPDNVLIDVRTRRAYLIDFGICHGKGQALETGKIVGTPRFLSPEQARGRLDARTDVWGLGALVRYVFTGQPPIASSSPLRRQERDERIQELKEGEAKARNEGRATQADELASRRKALEAPSFRTLDDMLEDAREARYEPLPDAVPPAARAIIEKAMARDPAERYARAADLAADLSAWTQGGSVRALAERDAAGAAVAAAQRTMRRYVGPALLAAAGLVAGLALGAWFLSGPDRSIRERRVEAERGLGRLAADVARLERVTDPLEMSVVWEATREHVRALRARIEGLPGESNPGALVARLDALAEAVREPSVHLEGSAAEWVAEPAAGGPPVPLAQGATPLPPGLYVATSRSRPGVRVPFEVRPHAAGSAGEDPRLAEGVNLPLASPAEGTVYIPPTPTGAAEDGTGSGGAFLLQTREVTCLEYAEWLDEVPDDERATRVPRVGFRADEGTRGRFLVVPGFDDLPVTGIRPMDALAYASWRAEVYGRPHRLPRPEEWRAAAGAAWPPPTAAALFRPLRASPQGAAQPDVSPYGAENLYGAPPELCQRPDGRLVLVGRGGPAGAPLGDLDAEPEMVAADQVLDASFRLVLPLEE